ncbi:hypothetical protein [Burkholderia cepacia]|uniref:hypothetical protein n=1 Tax=Burkholderia cepacia TaxID=292 RepID=UPI001F285841|nr:hypothetical protein [Burkholderia cepacia]MCE4131553.1 hypothetical protein [Burkholderia cepacia]
MAFADTQGRKPSRQSAIGNRQSAIGRQQAAGGRRQAVAVARFPTFTGELGAADSVGQHHASDFREGAEHPPRQVGNCAKAGSTYGVDITATWVWLAVSSKQAGRYGDTASVTSPPAER